MLEYQYMLRQMILETGKMRGETKDLRSKSALLSNCRVGSARSHTAIVFIIAACEISRVSSKLCPRTEMHILLWKAWTLLWLLNVNQELSFLKQKYYGIFYFETGTLNVPR